MTQSAVAPTSTPKERRKVVAASIIGTTIEWYDFFIYAFAANLILAKLFFEPAGPGMMQILSLVTIGLSFLFRPLGAFLAGHFGDKLGRQPMLVITLLLMGIATVGIGLLPTYQSIGIAAPILLVLLRILQGLSAGGEWGGAVLMSVEHAPKGKRGLFGIFPQLGVPFGMLLASAMLALMRVIAPGDAFEEWGWRVPFLFSVVLIIVGFIIRRTVDESPVFSEIAEAKQQESAPIVQIFKRHLPLVILSALLFAGNNAVGYMLTGGYVQGLASRPEVDGGLGYDPVQVQLAVLTAAIVWAIFTYLSGPLSDRYGRKPIMAIGWIVQAIGVIPLFQFVFNGGVVGVLLGTCLLAVGLGLTYGPAAVWFAESFPASVRYSGISISYALGGVIGGAFAPTIAQILLQTFGSTWAIVVYLLIMTSLGMLATILLRDRSNIPLDLEFERSGQWKSWTPQGK
ncbi:MFS transporter [Leucobacter luti]|uniref:Putative proline/betaine transporter n=1 Tax=Leucobacter luti TaxID=340320 RepID=A0A4R6S7U5_9MICO|nr:MFS transporter [Leucobacter luti]MCW2288916.1 MFS family permease [Leucobacter luti]QYM75198.1 MHS family MFS transporter [Leucobacter luti]TCK44932.1 putative MFS family arabinose efflux permease [Leucobacter luti]TDP95454.1 putative MFS family arabinose efflux permease [Leucobacter luti]